MLGWGDTEEKGRRYGEMCEEGAGGNSFPLSMVGVYGATTG